MKIIKEKKSKNKTKIVKSLLLVVLILTNTQPSIFASSVNELKTEVNNSNDTIEKNKETIATNQNEIKSLGSQIASIESKLAQKRKQLTDVNDSISELETSIGDLQSSMDDLESSINNLEKSIGEKEDELADLKVELETNKELSASILISLQKNSNVNYILGMLMGDSKNFVEKINTLNGLNRLANDSFEIIQETIDVTNKVESATLALKQNKKDLQVKQDNLAKQKSDLEAQESDLEKKKDVLASDSEALVNQSQTLSTKEDKLVADITKLQNLNSEEKNELLEKNDLLAKYQNAGCSGNDVYGVDCAVPPSAKAIKEQTKAQDETVIKDVPPATGGGSYVAKLKADPNANYIINRESGWDPYATNASSGAYGICQALPGSKMASVGSDWATNIETQAKWCNSYAMERYGSWAAARSFWDANHWW